jgi:hypothetical protein
MSFQLKGEIFIKMSNIVVQNNPESQNNRLKTYEHHRRKLGGTLEYRHVGNCLPAHLISDDYGSCFLFGKQGLVNEFFHQFRICLSGRLVHDLAYEKTDRLGHPPFDLLHDIRVSGDHFIENNH